MKKLLFPLLILMFMFSGCTISEHIYFNEDFSGEVTYSFDLSMIKTFADNDTSDFAGDIEKSMNDAAMELKNIEGISDIKSSYDDESAKASITYKFRDIDALNRSYENKESFKKETSPIPQKKFELKGKKLIYTLPSMPRDSSYQQMGEMKDMFQYEFAMRFQKQVNKMKFKEGDKSFLLKSGNSMELYKKGNIYEVFPEEETEVIISFKK